MEWYRGERKAFVSEVRRGLFVVRIVWKPKKDRVFGKEG